MRLSRAALWSLTSCKLKRIQRAFWGSRKTQAAAVRPPPQQTCHPKLWISISVTRSGYLPGYLTSPFLNGIIFSAGPCGAMHCGPWCCQAGHKLTRKPVASAFPRPFGAVMFTTLRRPVLTPLCVGAPPHQPPNQLVQPSITVHQIQVQKLFCVKGLFFTPILILVSDPFLRVLIIYVIEFILSFILGVLWPHLSSNKGSDPGITSWQWKRLILSLKLHSGRKPLNRCGIIIHTLKPTPESLWLATGGVNRECHSVKKNKICALRQLSVKLHILENWYWEL